MTILDKTIEIINHINRRVGHAVAWLTLGVVLVQVLVVLLRYVFSIGFIWMQETVLYLHGLIFLLGAGYTLMFDRHVRVDILYRGGTARYRALVDLVGGTFLLIPLCIATVWLSATYVVSSWSVLEGSGAIGGLPLVFVLKSAIWIFATLLGLQGVIMVLRALRFLTGSGNAYAANVSGADE